MPVAGLDDALDLFCGVGYLVHVAHGKVDLLHVLRSSEIPAHRIGNQDGLVLDLGIAKVVETLLEDADNGERNAADFESRTHSLVVAAEPFAGKQLGDHGALDVGRIILVVEKTAHGHQQVADVLVLRADTQHQRILDHARPKGDALMHFKHGRGVDHARHPGYHGLFVVEGEGVVVEDALRRSSAAAGVFQLDGVGLDLLQFLEDVLLAGHSNGDHPDERGGANDHAQRGKRKSHLAGAEALHGELQDLAELHGALGAFERLLEGAFAGLVGWNGRIHLVLSRRCVNAACGFYNHGSPVDKVRNWTRSDSFL